MSLKIIFIIIITVILTIFFLENNQIIEISLWIFSARISKSILLPSLTFIGFLIGYITGHLNSYSRNKQKNIREAEKQRQLTLKLDQKQSIKTLSPEDEDYIR